MPWFGIRSVYLWGPKENGKNIFEERVVCFEAETPEQAHAKALTEAEEYAEANEFELYHESEGYRQDDEPLIEAYEVWSQLFESFQSLEEFYHARYRAYDYHPDDEASR